MNFEQFELMFGEEGMHTSMEKEELGAENTKMNQTLEGNLDFWEPSKETPQAAKAKEMQVGGDHYKKMRVQPWDVIDTLPHAQAIGFYRGNAIKYIMRAGEKGPAKEDYQKAVHYLQKLIETL